MWFKSVADLIRKSAVYLEPFHRQHLRLFRTLLLTNSILRTEKLVYVCHQHAKSSQIETNQNTSTRVHERLKKLFVFNDTEAKQFCAENPFLSINHLNYYESDGNNLNPDVIKQNPYIINCSFQEFRIKLKYLNEKGVGPDSLYAAKICTGTRLKGLRSDDINERIDFFINSLQFNKDDIQKIFEKHRSFVTMDLERLRRIKALLMVYGVELEYIRDDLWTFHRNEDKMRQRLEVAQSVGVTPIKPWLLRCSESSFQSVIQRQKEINDILGVQKDLIGYFAERLSCSEDDVRTMAGRFAGLLSINVPKVKQMIDALMLDFGFTSSQIQQFPFVFDHNVDSLRHRYAQLLESGCSPIQLHYLCLNSNQFSVLLEKIKRNC